MKSIQHWMREYAQSHTHPVNVTIHKICVPLIMLTLLGMLWTVPVPNIFKSVPLLNWATLFATFCMIYYFFLSFKLALGMLLQTSIMIALCHFGSMLFGFNLLWVSIGVFAIAWVFQFIGHEKEGKKPSFFKDLQFLLIGPLWVLYSLYRKLGIKI